MNRKDRYIKILGLLSETQQHEKITDCLEYYGAHGTRNLTEDQLREYCIIILNSMKEEKPHCLRH